MPDRSVVLIDVRSTVGPLSFGAVGATGEIEADIAGGTIRPGSRPAAHLEIAVEELRSGNGLYDAELLRRIDARRYPLVTLDLHDCRAVGPGSRYRLVGELAFHGVTRQVEGTVELTAVSGAPAGGHGRAGVRHPRLRRAVAHGAHAADLPRRACPPARRGRDRGGLMGIFVALAVGYVIGARVGSRDLDQVTESLKALAASDEFADVVGAVRSHLGHTLRELAGVLDGGGDATVAEPVDLVDRVKLIVGRD